MELIFRVLMWLLLIASILFIPVCLLMLLKKCVTLNVALFISTSVVLLFVLILGTLNSNPIIIVPSEYQVYVNDSEKEMIQSYTSGIYSMNIPFVPICVKVVYADENTSKVSTTYFPFGSTTMLISDSDVPSLENGIFGQ